MNRIETINIANGKVLHKETLPINTPSDYTNHFEVLLDYLAHRVVEEMIYENGPALDEATINGQHFSAYHSETFSVLVSKTWIAWKDGDVITISAVVRDDTPLNIESPICGNNNN